MIRHEKNKGVGGAIIDCHKKALEEGMDIVAVIAGDNQMDSTQLYTLIDPIIDNKTDYAKGNRLYWRGALKGMSKWRTFGNVILTLMTKMSSGYWHISDPQNGYTAINIKALQRINLDEIYQGYLFENDMLTKLNAYDLRAMDIPIPARYGEEQSKIKYSSFIVKGLWTLTRNFFWRMKVKYVIRNFHPLILFYIFGIITTFIGLFATLWSIYMKLFAQQLLFERLTISLIVFGMGIQFLFFAMYFDMADNRRTMDLP